MGHIADKANIVNILLVDDEPDFYPVIQKRLSSISSFRSHLDWVDNGSEAINLLKSDSYDVYLLDYNLGARNGIDILKDAMSGGCKAPMILLTAQRDNQLAIEALKAGAINFIDKMDLSGMMLERAILYALHQSKEWNALNETLVTMIAKRINSIGGPMPM